MPTNHAAVAALPIASDSNKILLRNAITARMPYVLADADDVTDLVAVDPATGAAIIDILFLGRLFHYDATDTTTANDGITCLVTSDGRRYKLSDGSDVFAYSVLDNAIATPPASPTIGDAYLIASGATGAWAGKANYIGTYTRRGWEFINFGIGRFIYVEDTDTYYHKDSGGAWVAGFGNATFNANSIPLSAAINFGKRLIVEDQTTNAPPGTPTLGDAYIIGPSPTGDWVGHATDIAICENGSTFTIYTPTNGWSAYDKAQNNAYTFTGAAWISSAGTIVNTAVAESTSQNIPSVIGTTANVYSYSDSVGPSTAASLNHVKDSNTITYTAKRAGARIILEFSGRVHVADTGGGLTVNTTAFLLRDSVAASIDWAIVNLPTIVENNLVLKFEFDAVDNLEHTYSIGYTIQNFGAKLVTQLGRRKIRIMEIA